MKKIIFSIVAISLLFLSCDQEFIENIEEDTSSFSLTSKSTSARTSISCTPDLEALELGLPDVVEVHVTEKPGANAYFTIDILDTNLAGTNLEAWCVDQDLSLYANNKADFVVYSSYETLPPGEFEFPENFDLVNWMLNQNFIGQASVSGGNYTFGHVQYAMWLLVDDSVCIECSALAAPGEATWTSNSAVNVAMAQEIAQAARDNGEDFIPGCGQKIGVILNPSDKQAIMIVVDVPEKEIEEECFECEGKVTELELQYNGDEVAIVRVETKKEGENGEKVVFEGTLSPGETFSFVGNDKKGTLGTEIKIYVNYDLNTEIHTSCSKPIGPGLVSGDFEVISGSSREGGKLCPVDTPPGGGDDCSECEGKVTRLDLQYNGSGSAFIEVVQKKEGTAFSGNVNAGETFSFYGSDKKGTLGTEITIYVNGSEAQKIHTSCSVPIGAGSVFGNFTVIGGASREGGELCPVDTPPGGGDDCSECEGKVNRLDLQYNGLGSAFIEVVQKKDGTAFSGNVNAGETFSFFGSDKKGTLGTEITIYVNGSESQKIHTSCSVPIGAGSVFGNFTVIGGASREGGELCPADTPPVSNGCDCDGKIVKMKLIYDGPNSATVTVAGENGSVLKTFTNVSNGDILLADLGNVGKWWYWSVDGNLQASIHTSCSDDILGNENSTKSVFGNLGTFPDPADNIGEKNDGTFLVISHTDENGNTCNLNVG
ncbi:DUF7467 domain-containing protein [Algibacter sp.]|uniref:DUF7467 domain-containing protein n=1 Tax=Algibacter sp. TaxID=1872428 RepID=UPI003C7779C2